MYKTEKENDRVILIGFEEDLTELAELAKTAGCIVIGELHQNREKPHPKSYFGKGKAEELAEYTKNLEATMIIADDELSAVQLGYLGEVCGIKVIDRTMIILDIFANNAKSAEAIAQVEVAQQRYNMSRLKGFGINMSRLGGGIGTRGPGEKKLETDRRAIRDRINELESELKQIQSHRQNLRKSRLKNERPVISLVGYTNAGKSTLMNALTNANVVAQDKLFATLDTTTKKITFGTTSREILLTDTVGFIKKLPHTLVKAFRSTLEELSYSTIILHIVDISNENYENHMETVYDTMSNLNCDGIPVITVFNKIDNLDSIDKILFDEKAAETVSISAKTGDNINKVIEKIEVLLQKLTTTIELVVPHDRGDVLNIFYKEENIIEKNYSESGVYIKANISDKNLSLAKKFQIK